MTVEIRPSGLDGMFDVLLFGPGGWMTIGYWPLMGAENMARALKVTLAIPLD